LSVCPEEGIFRAVSAPKRREAGVDGPNPLNKVKGGIEKEEGKRGERGGKEEMAYFNNIIIFFL